MRNIPIPYKMVALVAFITIFSAVGYVYPLSIDSTFSLEDFSRVIRSLLGGEDSSSVQNADKENKDQSVFDKMVNDRSSKDESVNTESARTQPDTSNRTAPEPAHGYQSGPIVDLERKSYFVRGTDREDLCEQIASDERTLKDDFVEVGFIEYNLRYVYKTIYTNEGYTLGDFTITTDSTITVPQWESSGGASDDTKNDWRVFKNSVVEHEDAHQKILVEHANNLVWEFNNMGYYSTEGELIQSIESVSSSIENKLEEAQNAFDEKTQKEDNYFSDFCNNNY